MSHATPAHRPSRWMSLALFVLSLLLASAPLAAQTLLDPMSLTKYVDPLPIPGAMPMSLALGRAPVGCAVIAAASSARSNPMTPACATCFRMTIAGSTFPG